MTTMMTKPEHEVPADVMEATLERAAVKAAEMLAKLNAGEPVTALGLYETESGVAEVAVWRRGVDREGAIRSAVRHIAILEHHGVDALPPGDDDEQTVRELIEDSLIELAVFASDELAERITAQLPTDLIEHNDVDVVAGRQPIILAATSTTYRCDVTGEDQTGPAIVLRARPGSALSDDIGGAEYHVSPAALRAMLAEID